MKRLLVVFLVFVSITVSQAQQRAQYSQYMFSNYLLNPAISGIENYADVKVGYRRQWSGLQGAPSTYYASIHTSINNPDRNKLSGKYSGNRSYQMKGRSNANRNNKFYKTHAHHGIGFNVQSDKAGPLKNTAVNGTYAFHLPVSNRVKVAAGASMGVIQYSLNLHEVTMTNMNDPALSNENLNSLKFDIGLGTWIYSDNFFAGFSSMQLLRNEGDYQDANSLSGTARLQRHFYLTGGYRVDLSPELSLVPSAMVKMAKPSPASVDLNLKAIVANRVWGGVSYRHDDAIVTLVGVNLSPVVELGYSYDVSISEMSQVSSGSHEVVLGFRLQNRMQVLCPNWMW